MRDLAHSIPVSTDNVIHVDSTQKLQLGGQLFLSAFSLYSLQFILENNNNLMFCWFGNRKVSPTDSQADARQGVSEFMRDNS